MLESITAFNPAKVAPPFLITTLLEISVFLNLEEDRLPKSKESHEPKDFISSLINFELPLNTLKSSMISPSNEI